MDDLVWVILVAGGLIAIVALILVRKYYLVKILKVLRSDYAHIYNEHYPPDAEPDFLLTVKKGFLPFQLLRKKELKQDKELMSLIWMNVIIIEVQILLLLPFIIFCLIVVAVQV